MSVFGKINKRPDDENQERSGAAGAPYVPSEAAPQRVEPTSAPAPRGREREGRGDMANIGKSITIAGDLTGEEDLVIEGKVEGKVTLPNSQLTIGANGTIKAEVQAKSVVVIGRVSGNVRGTERVEIQATGIVEGDVVAPRLIVAEGAVLNGSIQMSAKPGAAVAHPSGGEVRKAG